MKSNIVMTFGTFDGLHPGHKYYLDQARKYGDHLVTVVARDITVEKIKGRSAQYREKKRQQLLQATEWSDEVVLGSIEDPYSVLLQYRPIVLCFGYDQHSFNDDRLIAFLRKHDLHPEVIVLEPLEPHRYKSSLIQATR